MAKKPVRKSATVRKSRTKAVMAETRRERVESKEEAIISAAYDMFVTRGFAKTTMSDIAKSAGVAEGTLYLYFNNKEALARGVLAAFYQRLTETAEQGSRNLKTTKERLTFLARHHLQNILKERRLLELLSLLNRDLETYEGSVIYKMNRAYVAVFDGILADGVWRGDIDESFSNWILRDIFFGSLEHAMRTMLIKGREKEIDRFVDELVR